MTAIDDSQLAFDDLDVSLSETTFVVVDLETTGTGRDAAITEIGAVKVRGGRVLGELATLVDPGAPIPPQIVALTGITQAMVHDAPRIEAVLPSFMEFARGAVLVAHNAGFDTSFLKAAAAASGIPWTFGPALCTVKLARRVLTRDEAPSCRLSALAQLFAVSVQPTHRALDDARATVEVLHALLERVGNRGVYSYRDLRSYLPNVSAAQRAKRTLADRLPSCPGVYIFRGPSDEALYVGTAVDLRRRVRGYFTGTEPRARMKEMIALASRVDHVPCAHRLEAGVRELRLIGAAAPPYNRRSKQPRRGWWIHLTDEPFARLSVVRLPRGDCLGPVTSRTTAADVADLLAEACELRTCRHRLGPAGVHGGADAPEACRIPTVGGCHAAGPPLTPGAYRPRVVAVRALFAGEDDAPLHALRRRLDDLAGRQLFETAARLRDRLDATIAALERCQRLAALCAIDELVAAASDGDGGWEFAVVRAGRLVAAGTARRGVPPMPVVDGLIASAETVEPGPGPLRGAPAEEASLVQRWLTRTPARIVSSTAGYAEPRRGAAPWLDWRERARAAPEEVMAMTAG